MSDEGEYIRRMNLTSKQYNYFVEAGLIKPPLPKCAHCGKEAFKSDGTGTLICENYANYGGCAGLKPARSEKVAQNNDPCPCGSGKKFKKCCKV